MLIRETCSKPLARECEKGIDYDGFQKKDTDNGEEIEV